MIPFIRSLSELMAITEARDKLSDSTKNNEFHCSPIDSGQRKRYLRSHEKNEIHLPDLPKNIRRKMLQKKQIISKFIDKLDYNNQIQSSFDLTLIECQNKRSQRDVA